MASLKNVALVWAVGFLAAAEAIAATESVRVTKAMDDKAIISRRNGESYLIEKGVGCLSLWRYEGKEILIVSPGLFLGVGSRLLIPEMDQECRIWNSEMLSGSTAPSLPTAFPVPTAAPTPPRPAPFDTGGILTIQKALRLVGYDPGPTDGAIGPKTTAALQEYMRAKGYLLTEDGLRKTFSALALDVVAKNPNDQDAIRLSLKLITLLSASATAPGQSAAAPHGSSGSGCEDGHWVETVSSRGEIVKLEDGSIWEINSIDRIDTMLWLPPEAITVCGNRLINTDTGEAVDATRIK